MGREYALFLPLYIGSRIQFCAPLAATIHLRLGCPRPLPFERADSSSGATKVCDRYGGIRYCWRVETDQGHERLRDRCSERRTGRTRLGDAALTSDLSGQSVRTEFRTWKLEFRRSPGPARCNPSQHCRDIRGGFHSTGRTPSLVSHVFARRRCSAESQSLPNGSV